MLSTAAMERLETVDSYLREVVYEAEKIVPLTVLEGHRGQEAQEAAFERGATKLHWPHGKHNAIPSLAVDLAPTYFQEGTKIDWDDLIAFGRIMGVVQAVAYRHGVKLRFGMDWDGDFRSVGRDPDESFLDAPHVEKVV
jgi:peptidoglycan L-alanyl-D-glutamate endopeptidase CwlK